MICLICQYGYSAILSQFQVNYILILSLAKHSLPNQTDSRAAQSFFMQYDC